jgi:hypothetical protein
MTMPRAAATATVAKKKNMKGDAIDPTELRESGMVVMHSSPN